ncbi:hypothetical protein [Fodinibius saliphilus]|uniref:hypothetical protein n=1 Tax=Fodinibius saliphilus TaxID=1920650 RepID=UPI001109D391|nr:hypothetical protein [Fodinibius saliphilus]
MKSTLNKKFRKYYQSGNYRGFYKVENRFLRNSKSKAVIFSNGEESIHTIGMFTEEALGKAFEAIDKYHRKQNAKSTLLT